MILERVPVGEAVGGIVVHTLRFGQRVLRKGSHVTAEIAEALRAAGVAEVTVARLEPGDVEENEAAEAAAHALAGDGIVVEPPHAGRCNLRATVPGMVVVDAARVDGFNRAGLGVLISTLADGGTAEPRRLIATVKTIPHAVPGAALEAGLDDLGRDADAALRVAAYVPLRIGLVQTITPGIKPELLAKGTQNLSARVESYGGTLVHEERCGHDPVAVAEAAAATIGHDADAVFVLGAASTADRHDVVPEGIERAGAPSSAMACRWTQATCWWWAGSPRLASLGCRVVPARPGSTASIWCCGGCSPASISPPTRCTAWGSAACWTSCPIGPTRERPDGSKQKLPAKS